MFRNRDITREWFDKLRCAKKNIAKSLLVREILSYSLEWLKPSRANIGTHPTVALLRPKGSLGF